MAIDVLKQIWPEWQVEEKPLGKGSFGVVYKAVRRDHNVESYAAVKVISIPSDPSEVDSLRSEGLDMDATRTYFQGIVDDFISEIQLMVSLKGVQNIVSVEDYKVVEKTDEIGWNIYIRMELLTPFNAYICDKKLTEEEVIKLGCDICTALEICGKRNIIHRDIKPENIFINDFGYFKLGDFGIARKIENITGGLSQKGTFNYMAPEVGNSSDYDARVDTYSLGIVLYRLLNGNRLPFLDTEKQLLNPNERRNAVDRRLRGEVLPPPCDASPAMTDLILRACAYDPNTRFSSATEMKQALMSVANDTYQATVAGDLDKTTSVCRAPVNYDRTTSVRKAPPEYSSFQNPVNTFGKKNSKVPAIIAAVLVITLLICGGKIAIPKLINSNSDEKQIDPINNYIPVEPKESPDASAGYSQFSGENLPDADAGVIEAAIETSQESGWVQTDQGHKFYIPDGFSPIGVCGPETGRSYYYSNPDLQMTISIWEDTADHLAYESGWEWIYEEYRAYERDLYEATQQKADNYFVIQGLNQQADAVCIRDQFIEPWIIQYTLTMEYPNNDSFRTESFQRICKEFADDFQYAESSAPTVAPDEFKKKKADEEEEKVAQIRSWYYAFQEEKKNCTTKTIDNATAYYLNGKIQSIELLNYEGGIREFYYYAPESQRLYFAYLEGMSDNTNQKRVYIWDGELVQWIDPSGTVRHDDPEKLLAYCSLVSVQQISFFDT